MPRMVQWPLVSIDRPPGQEGLRERKKRLVRQQLSDTATEMFLERGFDNVRVTEIAEACGVSEKTVYNYFPTKESLILDRWQSTPAALLRALADPNVPTVDAALRVIDDELTSWTTWIAGLADQVAATARFVGSAISSRPHRHCAPTSASRLTCSSDRLRWYWPGGWEWSPRIQSRGSRRP